MSEWKFTPGPWKISGYAGEHDEAGAHIVGADGSTICHAGHVFSRNDAEGWKRYYANADLIAASPDAVDLALEIINHLYTRQDIARAHAMARDFLRKAGLK